nr:hypothetical protein [Candidatus Sigynarchaeum springense]
MSTGNLNGIAGIGSVVAILLAIPIMLTNLFKLRLLASGHEDPAGRVLDVLSSGCETERGDVQGDATRGPRAFPSMVIPSRWRIAICRVGSAARS